MPTRKNLAAKVGVAVLGLALAAGLGPMTARAEDSETTLVKKVPASSTELLNLLALWHEGRSNGARLRVRAVNNHLEIDLDGMANAKYPDVYMPLKAGKVALAKTLVRRLRATSKDGKAPTQSDAAALFDMIDPHGQ